MEGSEMQAQWGEHFSPSSADFGDFPSFVLFSFSIRKLVSRKKKRIKKNSPCVWPLQQNSETSSP